LSTSSLQSRLARAEAEVQELKRQIEQGNVGWQPRPAEAYNAPARYAAFARLHALALSIWTRAQAGELGDDDRAACYEAVMGLLGPGVWAALEGMETERDA
jgi:hypothetical protein